jgi:uncharacterized protein YggE
MSRKFLIVLSAALLVITLGAAGCESLSPPSSAAGVSSLTGGIFNQQSTGIWVTGEGKVSAVPDVAILNLGVEVQSSSVAQAQEQAATAMTAVLAELSRFGVAEKDIKTSQFSIAPVRKWSEKDGREVLIGYRVTNTVTVKVRKTENTGAIIDAASSAGGDYIMINNISFTVDNPESYYDAARARAMADAATKAEQLADMAKVKVGKPTYISESLISAPVVRDFYAEAAMQAPVAATTPISAGEMEIRLSVQVVYSIE